MPVTKVGVEMPTSDTACTSRAVAPLGFSAHSTPSGMPSAKRQERGDDHQFQRGWQPLGDQLPSRDVDCGS